MKENNEIKISDVNTNLTNKETMMTAMAFWLWNTPVKLCELISKKQPKLEG